MRGCRLRKIILYSSFLTLSVWTGKAQMIDNQVMKTDSLERVMSNDTVINKEPISKLEIVSSSKQDVSPAVAVFKPNPTKAVIYSAIFPGLGQIYNRKYWKLPIVYGGFLGLTYAVTWNGNQLSDYSEAYKAIMSSDPKSPENRPKWEPYLRYGQNIDEMTVDEIKNQFEKPFQRKKDYFRRNRDLSIIGMVALYGLCMIDAYVDAQLFEFDISPDISMKVEPTMMSVGNGSNFLANQNTIGLQCSFKF